MGILSGSAKTKWGFCPGLQKLNGDFVRVCKNSMGILSGSAKTQWGFCKNMKGLCPESVNLSEGNFIWIPDYTAL